MNVLIFIFGSALASFVCLITDRWYQGPWLGRSHCNVCGQTLKAIHLLPIVAWTYLKGRCAYCNAVIPWRYVISEAIAGLAFLILYQSQAPLELYLLTLISLWLALMDIRYQQLPIVGLMLLGLFSLPGHGITAILLTLMAFLCHRQKWCGSGDIWLLGACGLWVPLSYLPIFLIMSGCFLILKGRLGQQPLAPGLLLALWLTLVVW